jgi:hypothetical protein
MQKQWLHWRNVLLFGASAASRLALAVFAVMLSCSGCDFVHRERIAADLATMTAIRQLCSSMLTPFERGSPADTLSQQTMDNAGLATGAYCSTGRARGLDELSLYYWLGEPSRAGVCAVARSTERCLQYLNQRVAGRQQRLPADAEARINELFAKMQRP